MKKLFICMSAAVILSSCGGEDQKPAATTEKPAAQTEASAGDPPKVSTEEKALELIKNLK